MKKTTDKLVAIILSVAVMLSTVVIGGVLSTSAEDTSTVTVLPDDAPASELLSETKIFTFDKVREFAVNKDYGIDQEGNAFYPVHSVSAKTSVKQKNFVVDGETVTTAEVSAGGKTVFIPTDENGQPFIIEPNTKYTVKIKFYTMAAIAHGQFFMGGGTLASNEQACKTSAMEKSFYLWEEGKTRYTYTSGWNPFYRCTGIGFAYDPRYFPEVKFETQTNTFRTLDFATEGGMFEQSTYKNTGTSAAPVYVSNEEYYDFGKYFGIFFSAGNVNVDGYNGNATYYIDEIEITANRSRTLEVGESYTFNFNEDEVIDTTVNSTKLTDGDGNTFYPLHGSSTTGTKAAQENITVKLDDKGNTQTVGTLKFVNNGKTSYIPTDANGVPFVLEPNTKYKVDIVSYSEFVGSEGQFFTGGGAYEASKQTYKPLDSYYNNNKSWYYVNGTDKGNPSGAMYAAYPMFRTSSFNYAMAAYRNMYSSSDPASTGKLRYFEDFVKGRAGQYESTSSYFQTSDYEEIVNDNGVGTNSFNTDLWQWFRYAYYSKNSSTGKVTQGEYYDLGITDPYSDLAKENGVVIENKNIGTYFCIYGEGTTVNAYYDDGSGTRVAMPKQYTTFYIDSITITKVSTTDIAEITFDANGGTFAEGTTLSADLTIGGDFSSVTAPTNADTTLSFAGWSTHSEGDPVSKVTSAMKGKTLYAIWKPAVANVTFDANGGKLADGSATKVTTQYKDLKFTEANPTRAGYIFMGWALSKDATTPVTVTTADMAGKTLYALWKADPISVTFNANGGKFSDGTITKIANQVTGIAPSFEAPIRSIDKFVGWSLSADSSTVVSTITKEMAGTTLYAVYEESHPANGVYNSWGRTIEFVPGTYKIVADQNTFVPTGAEYGDYRGVPYYSVIADPDEEGDGWLHYYNHYPAGGWTANWCLTPTPTGVTNTSSDQESGQVLPADSTYKMTFRIRVTDDAGTSLPIVMYYGTTQGRHTLDVGKTKTDNVTLYSGLKESDEWQTVDMYFTTPKEYAKLSGGVANRLFVGVYAANFKAEYDLDYIKIEKVSKTDLYVKEDGAYTLKETLYGNPGEAMTLPTTFSQENYSSFGPKGQEVKMTYGNWFFDEACSDPAIEKFGNFDAKLYVDTVTPVETASLDNQEMFAGFDVFTERTPATVNAAVSGDEYYSGKYSLKADVPANGKSSFEVRNDFTMELIEGMTYRVDFMYKTDKAAKLEIGYANGSVSNGVKVSATADLSATDNWKAGSATFTYDGTSSADILCANLTATNGAEVYIDAMYVSSLTKSVGVEAETTAEGEALRFMLSYNGTDEDTVLMAGKEYTVTEHGVLVKAEELDTALNLENKNANGIFHFAETDMTKNWSVNPVTGDTVYSAYLNGFDKNDDYKVSVRGYVKLADGTVFYTDTLTASVTDIPAAGELIPENADLNDFYVYLPAGTTFPADRNYTITTYDDFFAANNAEKNNTLTENSYVKFSARPDVAEINVPSEGKYLVHTGTKEELFYGVNYQVVTNDLNTVADGNVGYIFITDIHFGSSLTNTAGKSVIRQTELITKMANENDNIDFVVVAGDTTTGMYGSKEAAIQWTQAGLDPLLNCTKPVFVLMGNHDDNSYHIASGNKVLKPELVFSDLDWQNNIINRYTNKGNITVVQDDPAKRQNSKYYYYDLEGKKTRVIALDAIDYEAKYDENGVILGDLDGDGFFDGFPTRTTDATASDTAKYYNGYTYWGYSADQLRWLAEDALGTLPDGYEVIFVSHMGIDKDTNCYGSKIWFGDEIRDVIETFNAGGTYSGNFTDIWGNTVSVNADFSDINGEIAIWQFGHMHVEGSIYSEDINLWQICTSTCNVGNAGTQTTEQLQSGSINNKNLPWRVYARRYGDETEICFNVMSVSSERIYRYTIGQGANEKLVYPN